jgi:hypothetical protein
VYYDGKLTTAAFAENKPTTIDTLPRLSLRCDPLCKSNFYFIEVHENVHAAIHHKMINQVLKFS